MHTCVKYFSGLRTQLSLLNYDRALTFSSGVFLPLVSYLFQSFTEGELKKVIATLVDRKERRIRTETGRRTKRARKGPKPCSLHKIELMVSELGLGYESDETVRFRYCSGNCIHERRNYDFVMEHMQLNNGSSEKGRRGRDNGKKDKARYTPCCRPTKFEKKMSFFDNKGRFSTIQNVSARACGCVWHSANSGDYSENDYILRWQHRTFQHSVVTTGTLERATMWHAETMELFDNVGQIAIVKKDAERDPQCHHGKSESYRKVIRKTQGLNCLQPW